METILLEEENALEYIYDSICKVKNDGEEVKNAKYHHRGCREIK